MDNEPLVTIITVTYNAEEFLERTIKSVIAQNYKNIEFIIIDGSSSDKTIDIINKYKKYLAYWISEPDKGIYDAMNKGIEVTTGEWINFMNAGDTFSFTNSVQTIVQNINENIELIYGGYNFVNQDSSLRYEKPLDLSHIWNKMPCCHQSIFIKKEIMKKYKYSTHYKINGDLDFLIKFYINKHSYKYIDNPICNFLYDGLHTKDVPRRYLDEIFITSKYLKNCSDIYGHFSYKRLVKEDPNNGLLESDKYDLFNKLMNVVNNINNDFEEVIIYGNSSLGQVIEKFLTIQYKIADTNVKANALNLINPRDISKFNYDIVINTLIDRDSIIEKTLIDIGVKKSKIYFLSDKL